MNLLKLLHKIRYTGFFMPLSPMVFAGSLIEAGNSDINRWDNNVLPYSYASGVLPEIIDVTEKAIEHIENNSSIRFVLRDNSNASTYPNYIQVKSVVGDGCYSQLGNKNSGGQTLNLEPDGSCVQVKTAIHELLHALGFIHEQNRVDRDSYVNIDLSKADGSISANNWAITSNAVSTPQYDFKSIMHYGANQFALPGEVVITPINPNSKIDPSERLSDLDIEALETFYPPTKIVARLKEINRMVFVGEDITFDASDSFNPAGGSISYQWSFDGGQTYEAGSYTYKKSFLNATNNTVYLKVTSHTGIQDMVHLTVPITDISIFMAPILNLLLDHEA